MISIATVTNAHLEEFFVPTFLDSIINGLPSVSEVILAKYDCEPGYLKEEIRNSKRIVTFHSGEQAGDCPSSFCISHALNLHSAINRTTNDLVIICDGDIFFHPSVSELYKELFEKYNLNYIGCSHPAAATQAFTFFPNVLCAMFRKSDMPSEDFLKEHMVMSRAMGVNWVPDKNKFYGTERSLPGKYLLPSENHFQIQQDISRLVVIWYYGQKRETGGGCHSKLQTYTTIQLVSIRPISS